MRLSFVALLLLSAISCGRNSNAYHSFVISHDAIREQMSIREVFESGLADYMIKAGGKNVPGSTLPEKIPISSDCRRHVLDIHFGGGAFSVRVYCNMNGPADRQLIPPAIFSTKHDFLSGLEQYRKWMRFLSFRIESPALKIGGVFDSYEFVVDENGKVTSVSAISQAP